MKNILPNWTHNGKEITSHEDFTSDVIGFVYLITYTNGQMYIGKKLIRTTAELDALKSGLPRENHHSWRNRRKSGRIVKREIVYSNKPFVKYTGSTKLAGDLTVWKREILELCSSKIGLTYQETKYLFNYSVLENPAFINENINGKWFKGNIE